MYRPVTFFALTLFVACGGSPTGGTGDNGQSDPNLNIAITEAPDDSLQVDEVSGDSMVVEVTDDQGNPQEGTLINFSSEPEGCADSDVDALQSNANGNVFFEVTAGTESSTTIGGPCMAIAIQSREGRADRADSVELTILPGPLADWHWQEPADWDRDVQPGEVVDLSPWVRSASDKYGNPISLSDVVGSYPVEWSMEDRTSGGETCLSGTGEGPSGTGWTFSAPDFVERGYTLFRTTVIKSDSGEERDRWRVNIRLTVTNEELGHPGNDVVLEQFVAETPATDPPTLPDRCEG